MGAFLVQRNGGKQNERKKQMGTGTRAIYSKRPVQSFIKGNALVFLVYGGGKSRRNAAGAERVLEVCAGKREGKAEGRDGGQGL